jgi:transcriptional regulator with PAS, ATPase and Fis domain
VEIYLGSEGFIESHRNEERDGTGDVLHTTVAGEPSLAEIVGERGKRSIEAAYREHGYWLNEIAKYLGVHYSTVSRRLKALEMS